MSGDSRAAVDHPGFGRPELGSSEPLIEDTDYTFWGYPERYAWEKRAARKLRATMAETYDIASGRVPFLTMPHEGEA